MRGRQGTAGAGCMTASSLDGTTQLKRSVRQGPRRFDTLRRVAVQRFSWEAWKSIAGNWRTSRTSEIVRDSVYDVAGREVARPISDEQLEGRVTRVWRPRGLPSGVFYVSTRMGGRDQVRKLIWLGHTR